jgi:hypothetical protein
MIDQTNTLRVRGVKNYWETGTETGKLGNWKIGDPILVPVAKKLKTGDLGSSPDFWHPVKTRKPEPGAYIYFIYITCVFYFRFRLITSRPSFSLSPPFTPFSLSSVNDSMPLSLSLLPPSVHHT